MYYKRILTFKFPVLYSPNETVYFLGIFTSWIRCRICPCRSRIRIQKAYLYADLCGSGSETLAPGCCCSTLRFCGGKVATYLIILVKFLKKNYTN